IACSLGFDSQQTFNREFRKTAGVTPGQYRSQPEWRLLPLAGRAGISFSVPVPERVHLPEGRIVGRPLTFSGRIHEVRDNGAAAFSESVFAC
ncbi:AraC family transcriptional regulator, partial [Escherichia coli]